MDNPPKPGSVIRYSYLWAEEQRRGQQEGRKERPVLVLAIAVTEAGGETSVLSVAVTHTPPAKPDDAVSLPAETKHRLGLDDQPSWVVTTEANVFRWPGPDIRPIPGRVPATSIYGTVPARLLKRVVQQYLANRAKQRARLVHRTT